MSAFVSTMSTPPGGEWFWEDEHVFIHGPSYHVVVDAIRRHFAETGSTKDPAEALAEYMCPRMPRGFCRGDFGPRRPTADEMLAATERIVSGRMLADFITVQNRLDACAACPKCTRPVCITCRGVDEAIYGMFEGRRIRLPADAKSGVCGCTGAFTMGVASVLYDKDEKAWKGMPASCWRNRP